MAWKQEYINSNPADTRRLEISKIVTPEVEAFSNEEIAEILKMAQLEPIHIHAVIATAIYTGARRGEIAPVLCGRHFHNRVSNRKLDKTQAHQTNASLFLGLLTGKI